MSYIDVWRELEASDPQGRGRLRRRVHGEGVPDIYLELLLPERVRAIALEVASDVASDDAELPEARGLEHSLVSEVPGRARLLLELADPAAADIFGVLAEDLAVATAAAPDDESAVGAWCGRIARWKRLLRNAPYGLSPEMQRGLYAELLVLQEVLAPRTGIRESIAAWEGPSRSARDFQLAGWSVEVKSCAANQPQIVTINGERQLDSPTGDPLLLVHVSLEVQRAGGETLPSRVALVRADANGSGAESDLEERLFAYGYLDPHASRYKRVGYSIRDLRCFEVRDGFPRLIESALPDGVGRVRYSLAIAACTDFEVPIEDAIQRVAG